MIEQKYIDVIESLGWNIVGDPNGTGVDIQQKSPAGEDFSFYTDTADFPAGVLEYARNFDPDEHVELWIGHRGDGGCPSTIRELVDDAEAIKKMLKTLVNALITVHNCGRLWLLGDDLTAYDNLLDGITFDDIITQVHCNCRHITPDAVRKEADDLLKLRLADMRELLERNIDTIMVEAGKGRE